MLLGAISIVNAAYIGQGFVNSHLASDRGGGEAVNRRLSLCANGSQDLEQRKPGTQADRKRSHESSGPQMPHSSPVAAVMTRYFVAANSPPLYVSTERSVHVEL